MSSGNVLADPKEEVQVSEEEPENDTVADSEDSTPVVATPKTTTRSKGWIWLLVLVLLNGVVWTCLIGYVHSVQPPVYIQLQNMQSRLVPSA